MTMRIPRWKSVIEHNIKKHSDQTVVQIATLESKNENQVIPRVRSLIVRSFFDSPTNPGLSLILSSTDIRTPKVQQLIQNSNAELAWWIDPTKQQFRIASNIYLVPAPEHPLKARFMDLLENAGPETSLSQFKNNDWEEKRQEMFKGMSAHMKASWCRPIPGSMLKGGQTEADTWPQRLEEPDSTKEGHEEAKRLWDFALSNFALVVIDPVEVDWVDLVIPEKRTLFTKREGIPGGWDEQALVP